MNEESKTSGRRPSPPAAATPSEHRVFDRTLLHERRRRAAAAAASHDFLLKRVADDMAERLAFIERQFPEAANLGAHHGALSRRLRQLPGIARITDVEAVAELRAQCDGPTLDADDEILPFPPSSLDLVVSGLALQFVNDLPGVLIQIRRALKPDGLFLAAVLGGETLHELAAAWLQAESDITGGASPRVAPAIDLRDLGSLLQRAGFAMPVVDSDRVEVAYQAPLALMRDIKAMGASNALVARSRRFTRRDVLAHACDIYAKSHARADGRILATFEILTLTAWAPDPSQPKPLKPGSASMRLADALAAARQESEPKT